MRSCNKFMGLGVAAALFLSAGLVSAEEVEIAAVDAVVFANAAVDDADLEGTRGQGLDQPPPAGDQDGVAVILWDEMPRSNGSGAAPAANTGGTMVSSTVNGARY